MTNPTAWCLHCKKLRPITDVLTTCRYTYYKPKDAPAERLDVPQFARCIEGRFGCGHGVHAVVMLGVIEAVWWPKMTARKRKAIRLMMAEAALA